MEDENQTKSQEGQRDKTPHPFGVASQQHSGWWIWLFGFLIIGGAGVLFGLLAEDVWEKEIFSWDAPIMLAIHSYSVPWLDNFMIAVTNFGLPGGYFVAAAVVFWLWYRRKRFIALALLVSFGGSLLLTQTVKLIFSRPRPLVFTPLVSVQDFSFPSGHAMSAVALYGFIAYLCWQQNRRIWAGLCILIALLIAFSRIYLGVHYPSDILGAFTLGAAWVGVVILGARFYGERYHPKKASQDMRQSITGH